MSQQSGIMAEKIQLIHPEGKKAPSISKQSYKVFHKAITTVLQEHQPLSLGDMASKVEAYLTEHKIITPGIVEWLTVSVKQHLEHEGIIECYTENGRKLHRLKASKIKEG